MSELIAKSDNSKYKKMRKAFLWTGVTILIGELVFGAILILTGGWSIEVGRAQLTFFLLGVYLFVGVNNFVRIEKGDNVTRGLAWMSLGFNLVALLFGILLLWEVIPVVEYVDKTLSGYLGRNYTFQAAVPSIYSKMALVVLSLGTAGFWISNVLSIRETVKPVKPLKITAVICEIYCSGFAIVMTMIGFENLSDYENLLKWSQLSGLAALAFIITALAALIISRTNHAKNDNDGVLMQDDKEIQTTIQEMVEREVQERLKTELEKANNEIVPPLQSDDMPPIVRREEKGTVVQTNTSVADSRTNGNVFLDDQTSVQTDESLTQINEPTTQSNESSIRDDGTSVQANEPNNSTQE